MTGVVVRGRRRVSAPTPCSGRGCQVETDARVSGAIFWHNGRVGQDAVVIDAIAGRNVHVGRGATVGAGAVLGDKTAITDYSKV